MRDKCNALAAVAVEMDFRAFELDDDPRLALFALAKEAQDGVGSLRAHGFFRLAVPEILSLRRSVVAQRVAEDLGQEIAFHLRFVELGEPAGGFQVGPFY